MKFGKKQDKNGMTILPLPPRLGEAWVGGEGRGEGDSVDREGDSSGESLRYRASSRLFYNVCAFFAMAILLHAAEKFSLPPETTGFKSGPGAEIAMGQCVLCHSADYVSTQ